MNFDKLPDAGDQPAKRDPRAIPGPGWAVAGVIVLLVVAGGWWWRYHAVERQSGGESAGLSPETDAGQRADRSAATMAEVTRLDALIATHLRRRELAPARQLLHIARIRLERAASTPGSTGRDGELQLRLAYLNRHEFDLDRIQELAYGLMRPGADAASPAWLEVAITGELPSLVLGSGAGAIAEDEARFARRLAWVLGRPVVPAGVGQGVLRVNLPATE